MDEKYNALEANVRAAFSKETAHVKKHTEACDKQVQDLSLKVNNVEGKVDTCVSEYRQQGTYIKE